jgi:hypothetical protein
MRYLKVKWQQSNPRFPVWLYSELDDAGWEQRKVEVFVDDPPGYASKQETRGATFLGLEPVPPLSQISADPEFDAKEITADEFEDVWQRARSRSGLR